MKALFCVPVFALLVGCIHEPVASHLMGGAPEKATPPPDPAKVSACKTERTWHNVWVLSGTVLGGAGGLSGSMSAVSSDPNVQRDVAIGAAVAAVLAGLASAAAGITADNYSTDNCPQILQEAADSAPEPSPSK
jgi:branched-subunit amino acid ABC-type transport system permease component